MLIDIFLQTCMSVVPCPGLVNPWPISYAVSNSTTCHACSQVPKDHSSGRVSQAMGMHVQDPRR